MKTAGDLEIAVLAALPQNRVFPLATGSCMEEDPGAPAIVSAIHRNRQGLKGLLLARLLEGYSLRNPQSLGNIRFHFGTCPQATRITPPGKTAGTMWHSQPTQLLLQAWN